MMLLLLCSWLLAWRLHQIGMQQDGCWRVHNWRQNAGAANTITNAAAAAAATPFVCDQDICRRSVEDA